MTVSALKPLELTFIANIGINVHKELIVHAKPLL